MCGIYACINHDVSLPVDNDVLNRATDTMKHRGPDGRGCVALGNVGLGHRRLSIIDLSDAACQPMSNQDGTVWITYNGELYNYIELRKELESLGWVFQTQSDTEVILIGYCEWGERCLQRFNGMFAFAVWDAVRRRLFAARDRVGIKPLVYMDDGKRFVLASELRAILEDRSIPRSIDPVAMHHYFSFMYVPAPFTMIKNIKKLMPGHYLIVQDGKVTLHQYWDVTVSDEKISDPIYARELLFERIEQSVKMRLVADVPLGGFLSGGVDSSLVCAIASRYSTEQFNTFSIGFSNLVDFD